MLQKVTIKPIKNSKENKQNEIVSNQQKLVNRQLHQKKKEKNFFIQMPNKCYQYILICTRMYPFTPNTLNILLVFQIYFMIITYLHAYCC